MIVAFERIDTALAYAILNANGPFGCIVSGYRFVFGRLPEGSGQEWSINESGPQSTTDRANRAVRRVREIVLPVRPVQETEGSELAPMPAMHQKERAPESLTRIRRASALGAPHKFKEVPEEPEYPPGVVLVHVKDGKPLTPIGRKLLGLR